MQELLRNAWTGWQNYTSEGKFAALLLLVLLFLWFCAEECKEKQMLVYTTLMAVCCIFPVSAALLMKYQTNAYAYEWIWGYVPMTIMIAYGAVVFLSSGQSAITGQKKWRTAGMAAIAVLLIFLCGRLGQPIYENDEGLETVKAGTTNVEMKNAEAVLAELEASAGTQEICLWAPREIMTSARGRSGSIRLIYGRNIWDASLGAYFNQGYGITEERLYLWMCNAEDTGSGEYRAADGTVIDGKWCIDTAVAAGVNRIVFPDTLAAEDIQLLSEELGVSTRQLDGYYLFVL